MLKSIYVKILKKLKITNDIKEFRKCGVIIGNNTNIMGCSLDKTHPHLIEIGDNCTLTHCTLLAHDASTKKSLGKSKIGLISIGNNCFIGWGAIILPNVKIGDNCIIGAGAVVAKDIPSDSVVVGNPCKIIQRTSGYLEKHKSNMKSCPVFEVSYNKMTLDDKINQKKKLEKAKIGYDE